MTTRHDFVIVEDEPEPEPLISDLIRQCKDHPGATIRVGIYDRGKSATKCVNRQRRKFAIEEPDIEIWSAKLHTLQGFGVFCRYLPPETVRDDR